MCGELDGAGMRVLAVGGWGGGVVCGLGESEGVLWWGGRWGWWVGDCQFSWLYLFPCIFHLYFAL